MSGIKVGTVSDVSLRDGDALVTFAINGNVRLGSETTAHIRTGSLLGERMLTLESGRQRHDASDGCHPGLADVLAVLADAKRSATSTTDTAGTNTTTLNQSLDTLSATLDQIAPQMGPTFDGLTRLSRTLNSRNENLAELLQERRRRHRDSLRTQPAGQQAHPQRQRSCSKSCGAATSDRRAAGQHVGGGQAAAGVGARQRSKLGADAGAD